MKVYTVTATFFIDQLARPYCAKKSTL